LSAGHWPKVNPDPDSIRRRRQGEYAGLWFWIVAVMVAAYVVLDGFDLGAGVIYLFAAKTTTSDARCCAPSAPSGMATKFGCSLPAAHSTLLPAALCLEF